MSKKTIKNLIVWLIGIIACILLIFVVRYFVFPPSQNHPQGTVSLAEPDTVLSQRYDQQAAQKVSGRELVSRQENRHDILHQNIEPDMSIEIPSLDDLHDGGEYGDGGIVSRTYDPLLQRLELTPEETDRFRAFLSKRRMAWIEIKDELSNAAELGDDLGTLKNDLEDTAWGYEKLALELLGEENYIKYNQYNSALGIFLTDTVDDLEKELLESEEIDAPQKDQLTAAMANAFEDFISSMFPELSGPAGFMSEMNDPGVVETIVDNLDSLEEKYISSAANVLSESQMIKYQYVIQSKIDERRFFYQSTQKRNFLSDSEKDT